MKKKILITGASGLLGRALVNQFVNGDFFVLAQYHTSRPDDNKNCQWLRADFSDLAGIRDFLKKNRKQFSDCSYLINNYGPITGKDITDLKGEDFYFDYHHNVITAFEIIDFFIHYAPLQGVVNVGFEFLGEIKAYKKILTYAAAKNALQLLTKSFEKQYPDIGFNMVSLATLEGAAVKAKSSSPNRVSPESAAKEIFGLIKRRL